ncbi:hypothetical protein [Rhodocaloribacter sp.]
MNGTPEATAQPETHTGRTDLALPEARKPFSPPVLKPHGTLVIQAGSINLWEKK